jgi:methylglutaconyl-CoA hydratase
VCFWDFLAEPACTLVVEHGVGTITLNRPKQKNSLGGELINSLCDNLKACGSNDEVRMIVLTNAGNTFCAGANLKGGGEAARYSIVDLFKIMQECPKVILGKINGHCTGGGVGVASACDISVISKTAEVGFTEVRIGVAPAIISVVCLPKMRRADAAELMLSGEKFSGERAAEVGLINYCVAPDAIDAKVSEIAAKLVRGGPGALADTKSLVYRVPSMPVSEAFKWTAEMSGRRFQSEEAMQGIMAFNKREDAPWIPKSKL